MLKVKILITSLILIVLSFFLFTGCCGLCKSFADGFKQGLDSAKTPAATVGPVKMSLEDINEKGVPESSYVEVEGWPSYYDMVYTYYPSSTDPNTIDSVSNIYYPILSKKQYELYEKALYKDKDGKYMLDINKAKSLGLQIRVFVRHNENSKEFIDNPGEEEWTKYKGKTYSGKSIDEKALEVINTGEIAPLLHPDLILIYKE